MFNFNNRQIPESLFAQQRFKDRSFLAATFYDIWIILVHYWQLNLWFRFLDMLDF